MKLNDSSQADISQIRQDLLEFAFPDFTGRPGLREVSGRHMIDHLRRKHSVTCEDMWAITREFEALCIAERDSIWSDVSAQNLIEPPLPSKLDSLRRFLVLGLDFKITPDYEIKLIEINGFDSGMSGFAKLQLEAFGQRSDKALASAIHAYGTNQCAFLGALFALSGEPSWRFPAIKDLVDDRIREALGRPTLGSWEKIHPGWLKYRDVADMSGAANRVFRDKLALDSLLDGVRYLKPETLTSSPANFDRFRSQGHQYFVIKPTLGSVGREVHIHKFDDFSDPETVPRRRPKYSMDEYVIEPFIQSYGIPDRRTGKLHDGCMRYVVHLEEFYDGTYALHHFGGYWRLCPGTIDSYGNLKAMRANLSKKAITAKCSEGDLNLASNAAEEIVEVLVREFNRIENHQQFKRDSISLGLQLMEAA